MMYRDNVDPFKYAKELNEQLKNGGLLLVTGKLGDKGHFSEPNAMTIGWGFLGTMWGRPVWTVAVRHSRHTFKKMEENENWIVCALPANMKETLDFCGTKSGRDVDKFKEMKLTVKKGLTIDAPYLDECSIHYECKTIFKTDMKPGQLDATIEKEMYKTKDWHMIYMGEVKGVYINKNLEKVFP
jgi:flavin reductase (DIM6/NTAB) family NADH-FMN oxidoreductase RutF